MRVFEQPSVQHAGQIFIWPFSIRRPPVFYNAIITVFKFMCCSYYLTNGIKFNAYSGRYAVCGKCAVTHRMGQANTSRITSLIDEKPFNVIITGTITMQCNVVTKCIIRSDLTQLYLEHNRTIILEKFVTATENRNRFFV